MHVGNGVGNGTGGGTVIAGTGDGSGSGVAADGDGAGLADRCGLGGALPWTWTVAFRRRAR